MPCTHYVTGLQCCMYIMFTNLPTHRVNNQPRVSVLHDFNKITTDNIWTASDLASFTLNHLPFIAVDVAHTANHFLLAAAAAAWWLAICVSTAHHRYQSNHSGQFLSQTPQQLQENFFTATHFSFGRHETCQKSMAIKLMERRKKPILISNNNNS